MAVKWDIKDGVASPICDRCNKVCVILHPVGDEFLCDNCKKEDEKLEYAERI